MPLSLGRAWGGWRKQSRSRARGKLDETALSRATHRTVLAYHEVKNDWSKGGDREQRRREEPSRWRNAKEKGAGQ